MTRLGKPKVRTGCITCKIRKVKCDETKPHCLKCTKTSRKCDGYLQRSRWMYSWEELMQPKSVILSPCNGRSNREGRAWDFFTSMVAPGMSQFHDFDFWTQFVPQVGEREPIVRHAVISISSMYEHMKETQINKVDSPGSSFGLVHYNHALHQLRASGDDESIVLLACILFVCIEALQGNHSAAVEHCRHGVTILNRSPFGGPTWAKDYLIPMFVRLCIFPFFFGSSLSTFPELVIPNTLRIFTPYRSPHDIRLALDYLSIDVIRMIRSSDDYRQGSMWPMAAPDALYRDQKAISNNLGQWMRDFEAFQSSLDPSMAMSTATCLNLKIRCLVCKIWTDSCLDKSEMVYDQYLATFEHIVEMAEQMIADQANQHTATSGNTAFTFDVGCISPLYLVVIKCRDLKIRLRAAQVMRSLATKREFLWNAELLWVVGKRLVEKEHGVPSERWHATEYDTNTVPLPSDEMRIRDSMITETGFWPDEENHLVYHRKVSFLYWRGNGFEYEPEWLSIPPTVEIPTDSIPLVSFPLS
ncbi:hypothetical protein BX600DRAFT_418391 [Xylariales sp. PMI_506]|nr:hypothetical protein BX600DRAFT_418391 [Xylariales sp. PMI_506]